MQLPKFKRLEGGGGRNLVGEQGSKRAGGRLGEWDVLPWAINTLRMWSQWVVVDD